jgi:hypothetical protein
MSVKQYLTNDEIMARIKWLTSHYPEADFFRGIKLTRIRSPVRDCDSDLPERDDSGVRRRWIHFEFITSDQLKKFQEAWG